MSVLSPDIESPNLLETTGSDDLGNTIPPTDSQISHAQQITYWTAQSADVNGMLGGYPQVSRIDLQGSKNFIAKVRRLSRISSTAESTSAIVSASSSGKAPAPSSGGVDNRGINRAVDCGAGIGRITTGLLLHIAHTVDVVEPVSKFTDVLSTTKLKSDQGRLGTIFNVGLESWTPPTDHKYDIVWNQWCLGHLTDKQVVEYLRRVGRSLVGYDNLGRHQPDEQQGWIMVKENLSTDAWGEDVFDDADSSVTRSDEKFRQLFEEAGLKIVRTDLQTGFPKSLFPVKMYALRPK